MTRPPTATPAAQPAAAVKPAAAAQPAPAVSGSAPAISVPLTPAAPARLWGARLPMAIGLIASLVLIGGFGVWSVMARLAGAVVASGTIQVQSNRQVVQHPEGGVVAEIRVKDGDKVQAGDVLLRLDGSRMRSELAIVEGQLRELAARRARLEAERDGADDITFAGEELDWAQGDAEFASQIDSERTLFLARAEALAQETALLAEQNAQIGNRIAGVEAQLAAVKTQAQLLAQGLADQQALLRQGLTQATRVRDLQREEAGLQGQIGQLAAEIAALRGQMTSNDIARLQLVTKRREEAVTQLRDIQFRLVELAEQRIALAETLSRLDVRAPVDGIIYDTAVFAVNAVVQRAEPLMYVIPQDQPLVVAARVDGIHIDDIYLGQDVSLRISAFDARDTPEVTGKLVAISADVLTDEVTRQNYYAATVAPDPEALAALGNRSLLPGMPVEAFIRTSDRSPIAYLLEPFLIYFNRAFRG